MLNALKNVMNKTTTENMGVAYATSGSDCLDLFATIGALRANSDEEVIDRFVRAYAENPDYAMKILFFARDIRGGLGERKVFRNIFNWLSKNHPESVKKNIRYVAEFGRFDDLLSLMDTPCEKEMLMCLKDQFEKDMESLKFDGEVSLLGKWLPSVNASSKETVYYASKVAKAFGLNAASYRKALSALRKQISIIENNLREKDYSFDYSKQPSKALLKYRQAFLRNDREKYVEFLNKVNSGEATLNADTLVPYEIVNKCLKLKDFWMKNPAVSSCKFTSDEALALDTTWKSLPDYGGDENMLAVVDGSGSMYGFGNPIPATVALSLGIYFAERNKGMFHDHFITFSNKPQLVEIKGETIVDKVRYVTTFNEVANTNLKAVFDLLLKTAKRNRLEQKEMPSKIVIISDMEFDYMVNNADSTVFEAAKRDFEEAGYKLPDVVFWNVQSRNRQQPVKQNDQGVALVSGATPNLFEMIAKGELSPYKFMMEVIENKRYAVIAA